MAFSDVVTQVTWGSQNTVNLLAAETQTSDLVTISGAAVERWVRVKAAGTAEAGKTIEVHVLSVDDVDADAADDEATQHTLACVLDTGSTPAVADCEIFVPPGVTGIKVKLVSTTATNSYTCSAVLHERTWS